MEVVTSCEMNLLLSQLQFTSKKENEREMDVWIIRVLNG